MYIRLRHLFDTSIGIDVFRASIAWPLRSIFKRKGTVYVRSDIRLDKSMVKNDEYHCRVSSQKAYLHGYH